MHNSNIPSSRELPSSAKLIKSTIIAAITAVVLLVTTVLPAEYGIDPTGIGNMLGLKRMGEIKVSLAEEAAADAAVDAKTATPAAQVAVAKPIKMETPEGAAIRNDTMQITLAPDEGTEIKVAMAKDTSVNYTWSTSGGKANFDVHGDSQKLGINYHSYEKGSEVEKQGTIVAAFDGSHGWFWRNRTSGTMTVTLKTSGAYTAIKHMK
jgi:hypothetical protein